jgi:hypothetical protein
MPSSGTLRRLTLVRTDVSEDPSASFIRVTRICELGTTLAATINRRTLRRNTKSHGVTSQKTPSYQYLFLEDVTEMFQQLQLYIHAYCNNIGFNLPWSTSIITEGIRTVQYSHGLQAAGLGSIPGSTRLVSYTPSSPLLEPILSSRYLLLFPRVNSCRSVNLTTHIHVQSRLRKSGLYFRSLMLSCHCLTN